MHADDEVYLSAPTLGDRLAVWVATGLGIGLVAPAPGTIGGLWGLLLIPAVTSLDHMGAQIGVALLLAAIAAPICGAAARALGASSDPGAIVLDEIVALPIVFIGIPAPNWPTIAAGYLLFRLCDICKPGLAREAEKLPGGLGIVADDFLAAVLACLLLHGAQWLDHATGLAWLTTSA